MQDTTEPKKYERDEITLAAVNLARVAKANEIQRGDIILSGLSTNEIQAYVVDKVLWLDTMFIQFISNDGAVLNSYADRSVYCYRPTDPTFGSPRTP